MNAAILHKNVCARVGLSNMVRRNCSKDYDHLSYFMNVAVFVFETAASLPRPAVFDVAMRALADRRARRLYKVGPDTFRLLHLGLSAAEEAVCGLDQETLLAADKEIAARVAAAKKRGLTMIGKVKT